MREGGLRQVTLHRELREPSGNQLFRALARCHELIHTDTYKWGKRESSSAR